MLNAFFLSLGQLFDRRVAAVFVKSLLVTLLLFAAVSVGIWFGAHRVADALGAWLGDGRWSRDAADIATIVLVLLAHWLMFRAIAIGVIGIFADEVVAAVEARHYPGAHADARDVPFGRSVLMGLGSAARLILVNVLLSPLYLILLVTGVGTAIALLPRQCLAAGARPGGHGRGAPPAGARAARLAQPHALPPLRAGRGGDRAVLRAGAQPARAGDRRGDGGAHVPPGETGMRAIAAAGALALLLAGCGEAQVARPAVAAARPAPYVPIPGSVAAPAAVTPASVRGQDARALIARFGQPRIDLQEGPARKLQFLGTSCVLDAYLYAPAGSRAPVVTHVDTRQRNGLPADEAGCVAALTRQP
ncbi:MAG: EI24 domain-containing protein [Sphingomonas sp.]